MLPQQYKNGLDHLVCSTAESLNARNLNEATGIPFILTDLIDQQLRELVEDAYSFATSFVAHSE
jgi:hypothetical protein